MKACRNSLLLMPFKSDSECPERPSLIKGLREFIGFVMPFKSDSECPQRPSLMKACGNSLVLLCPLSRIPNVLQGLLEWRPAGIHFTFMPFKSPFKCRWCVSSWALQLGLIDLHFAWEFTGDSMVCELLSFAAWVDRFALCLRIHR